MSLLESTDHLPDLLESFQQLIRKGDIRTVFQPIISLRNSSILGYEALSRGPSGSDMERPALLFDLAEKTNKLWELELICRSKALEATHCLQIQSKLFLNVNPNIMHDIKFRQGFTKEYLNKFRINPDRIVFEITEREAVNNIRDFKKAVQNYKDQDYQIAIDDAGAGYSGLNMISDIHPHYIKLDMNLIRDIDKDHTKQALIKSMSEFAMLSNTFLIAEGIETEKELLKLIEIGVHYGQGYFIQKPESTLSPINCVLKNLISDSNAKKSHLFDTRISDVYIGNICKPLITLDPAIKISQANQMIRSDPTLPGFCVIENGKLLGVATRNQMNAKLSSQYGYSLYCNKGIGSIMCRDFLCVDFKTPIDLVVKIAMQRDPEKLYDFITITKDGIYNGIATVKDLLEKTMQIEVVNAKHLNPLSGLPGNLLIEKQLEECRNSPDRSCILYFDIDNFKAYNDVYGFEKGDLVLKNLTRILVGNIPADYFVGHIGGDDFISVVPPELADTVCRHVIEEFDMLAQNFHTETDFNRGYIISKNRRGIEEIYPLMSITIAGITNTNFQNIYDMSENASKIKSICKQRDGSNYILT